MTADQFLDLVAADPLSGGGRSRRRKSQIQSAGDLATVAYRHTGSFGEGAEQGS
jgi:hypothetical protein